MDFYLFNLINQFAGRFVWLDALAVFLANGYFLILILLYLAMKNWKIYFPVMINATMAAILSRFAITNIIRLIVQRPRPFVENHVNFLLPQGIESSFPSGHASFYFAIATVVFLHNKKLGILFFIGSILMGIARVFGGVHWPSDILGGAIIGIIVGFIVKFLFQKFIAVKNK